MIREVGRNLGTKSLGGCFEVSNAFDPTVRRFVPSLPIHREKERECRRDRRAQIYIYIYTDPREQISGRASQLGIGSGSGLTGALFVLASSCWVLRFRSSYSAYRVSPTTRETSFSSSSGKLAPSWRNKGTFSSLVKTCDLTP